MKKPKMIDYARAEYARMIGLPFNSIERTYGQRYMAFLRDFIAEKEKRSSRDVQEEYEAKRDFGAVEWNTALRERLLKERRGFPAWPT